MGGELTGGKSDIGSIISPANSLTVFLLVEVDSSCSSRSSGSHGKGGMCEER